MAPNVDSDTDTVLADLELTRGLTIQMTALSTLGVFVAAIALSGLYQAAPAPRPRSSFRPVSPGGQMR